MDLPVDRSLGLLGRLPLELRLNVYSFFTGHTVYMHNASLSDTTVYIFNALLRDSDRSTYNWAKCVAGAIEAKRVVEGISYSESVYYGKPGRWYGDCVDEPLQTINVAAQSQSSNGLGDLHSLFLTSRQVYHECEPLFWRQSIIVLWWQHLDDFARRFLRPYPQVHNLKRPRSSIIRHIHLIVPTRQFHGSLMEYEPYNHALTDLVQLQYWKSLQSLSLTLTPQLGGQLTSQMGFVHFQKALAPCLANLQEFKVYYFFEEDGTRTFSLVDHDHLPEGEQSVSSANPWPTFTKRRPVVTEPT